jgi:transposase
MFWGGFNGTTKGPCLFWEKEWGTINQESYSARVIPLIHGWLRMYPLLQLMQDGAPGHTGGNTRAELLERGIRSIFWPAFSPDLNPIETVWNKMKDYIALKYPEKLTYDQLRAAVQEAWDSISEEFLRDLIADMPNRCEAVINAKGGHTKY